MSRIEQFQYDNRITRAFGMAAFIWALVGMLVGLILAFQLIFPELNFSQTGITSRSGACVHCIPMP